MTRAGLLFLFVAALAPAFLPNAAAQTSAAGAISGTVQDNTSAVVPGATVTLTSSSGATQTVTSNERGEYRIPGLAPGTYKVVVSATGFKDFEVPTVVVTAGQTSRVDATVVLAGVSSTINVQSQAATEIQTESAQITNEITTAEIETLGLNGRNFTQLAALAPGVSNQSGQDEALVGVKGSVKYSVNGGRVEYNTYDVDGGDILNASINGSSSSLIVYPSLDAIDDMQVLTSNYGAMYGRSASGTIIATTKTGTNSFHGDGYFYFRNNHLNARNFFDPQGPAPVYHKYDQGATIGGPLYIPGHYNSNKDKTFFFLSEEYRHERAPQTFNQGVPSLEERDCTKATWNNGNPNPYCTDALAGTTMPRDYSTYGDFSDVCPSVAPGSSISPGGSAVFLRAPIKGYKGPGTNNGHYYPDCPGRPTSPVGTYDTFPGNLVPIDPISQQILNTGLIPNPTPGAVNCNGAADSCYSATLSPLTTWRQELFRIDHNFTPKEKLYFRYIHDAWRTVSLTPQWGYVQNSFPTVQNQFVGPGLSMVAHWTSTISNSLVNDAAISYTTDHISLTDIPENSNVKLARPSSFANAICVSDIDSNNPTASCGMGSIFAPSGANPFGGKLPGIVIGGTNAAYGGHGFAVDPSYMPWHHSNPTYNMRDDATLVLGKHTLSFGVQVVIAQRNEVNPPVGANNGDLQGIATFTDINNRNSSGNAFADFLGSQGGTLLNYSTNPPTPEILPGPPAIQAFQQDSAQYDYHNSYTTIEPYVQDDWKVTSRLTLNLGLRFSLFDLYREKYLHAYNWLPTKFSSALASEVTVNPTSGALQLTSGTPVLISLSNIDPHLVNGVRQCGVNGIPAGCMTNHFVNPSPRVGFAWDPTGKGKISIRAGYGIFFEHGTGNEANTGSLEGSPGYPGGVLDMTQYFPQSWGCIGSGCSQTPTLQGAFPLNVTSIPTKVVWPYVQQWSFSVQRQLPWSLLGSIAYVGTKGTHLTAELQVNQLVPVNASQNPFFPGQPLGFTVNGVDACHGFNQGTFTVNGKMIGPQDPGYNNLEAACTGVVNQIPTPNALRTPGYAIAPGMGQIFSLQNIAKSSYNALQITLRRSSGPLNLGLSYSYSHSFDDASDRTSATFINAYNLDQNRASSDFDQRHLLNINYAYQLSGLGRLLARIGRWEMDSLGSPKNPKGSDASPWADHYFGGWQLTGITIFATGTPFTVLNGGSPNGISSADNAGVAAGLGPGSYPDVIRTNAQPLGNPSSGTFGPLLGNPMQFIAPQGLTYGNAGRNYLNNPVQFNFDVSLIRDVKVKESRTLEFRIETYNIFNHTQFRIYDPANVGNTGNNVITCYDSFDNSTKPYIPANSAGDSSCTGNSSFLHPVDAHRSRTMQLAVKFVF